jgi:hypothetical protein
VVTEVLPQQALYVLMLVFIVPEEQVLVGTDLVLAVVLKAVQLHAGATDTVQAAPDPWSSTQAPSTVQVDQLEGAATSAAVH